MIQVNLTNAVIGGLTLGTASLYYRFFYGRVLGISGFLGAVINPLDSVESFKRLFILGLLSSGFFAHYLSNSLINSDLSVVNLSLYHASISGLLVGVGTRLGNGCTSGHGLCGMSRFAIRSLVSVLTFITTGAITRMIFNTSPAESFVINSSNITLPTITPLAVAFSICAVSYVASHTVWNKAKFLNSLSLVWGVLFGSGLIMTQMTSQQKVFDFLNFPSLFTDKIRFDPSLAVVLASGLVPSLIGNVMMNEKKPLLCKTSHLGDPSRKVTFNLVLGAALFGIGWGLGGICPGPGIVLFGNEIASGKAGLSGPMTMWTLAFFLGSQLAAHH